MLVKDCVKDSTDSKRAAEEAIARSKESKSKWKEN
jgi:hypothetical protein